MAKSTRAQEVATGTSDSYTEAEKADENPPIRIRRAVLGADHMPDREEEGELVSVGTDSSEFSENELTSSEHEIPNRQEPAQTTENPSEVTEMESSDAISTDGSGQTTEMELSDEEEELVNYSEWEYKDLQAECKERGLPASGKHEDLVARLVEFDEGSESEEDDEFS